MSAEYRRRGTTYYASLRRARRVGRRRGSRRAKREERLDRLVPDRVCPTCGRYVPFSRGWRISGDVAMCVRCAMKRKGA